jgi:hypothetical protein
VVQTHQDGISNLLLDGEIHQPRQQSAAEPKASTGQVCAACVGVVAGTAICARTPISRCPSRWLFDGWADGHLSSVEPVAHVGWRWFRGSREDRHQGA